MSNAASKSKGRTSDGSHALLSPLPVRDAAPHQDPAVSRPPVDFDDPSTWIASAPLVDRGGTMMWVDGYLTMAYGDQENPLRH